MGNVRTLVKDSSGLGEGVSFRNHLLNLGSGIGGDITLLEVSAIEIVVAEQEYQVMVVDEEYKAVVRDDIITIIIEDE